MALVLALVAPASGADPSGASPPKWSPWIEFGGYYSNERSRGEAALFAPLWQSRVGLIFADLRGKLFEDNLREGNFALGYRHMLASGWNVGVWGGYDIRRSEIGNTFSQFSGGLELLSDVWDFRVNGYVPLTDPKNSPTLAEVVLSGNQISLIGGREVPLHGVDGEVGVKIPLGFASSSPVGGIQHELRVYAGGFWFDASEALKEVAGPKARLEWRISELLPALPGSRFTFETEWRDDDVRGSVWEVGGRLRIPFSIDRKLARVSLTPQERRMIDGLERDTDIVSTKSGAESVQDALTGTGLNRVAYVDTGGSVTTTSTNAGANSLIVVRGNPTSGAQTLQGNQTLLGTGTPLQVRGVTSGVVASFTAPGAMPTLAIAANQSNLTLAGSNIHVAGLAIQGAGAGNGGNNGVSFGSNLSNMVIDRLQISNVGFAGVQFANNNVVNVVDTTVTNANVFGLNFDSNNIVNISRVTINAGATVTDDAMEFNGGNTVAMFNSRFTGAFQNDGIDMNVAGNTVSGTGNVATGATFGIGFCAITGAQTGQFGFDVGTCP